MRKSKPIQHFFAVSALCSQMMEGRPSLKSADAQNQLPTRPVPNQTEIAKKSILTYFKKLPFRLSENTLELTGFGDFRFYQHLAEQDANQSPFKIFQFNQMRRLPSEEWTLSFESNPYQFQDLINANYGMCAGVTILTRRMNLLAIYDLENLENQLIPSRETNPEAYLRFMQSKIDDILGFKMAVIPGFSNLRDFSSDPLVQTYLKQKAIDLWSDTNVNLLQGLKQGLLSTRKEAMTAKEVATLHSNLSSRLNLGYNPIIYMAQPNKNTFTGDQWIHTVQVTGLTPIAQDGTFRMQIWDVSNRYFIASKTVVMNADGTATYLGSKVGSISMLQWDDLEIAKIIGKNLDFCSKNPSMCLGSRFKSSEAHSQASLTRNP